MNSPLPYNSRFDELLALTTRLTPAEQRQLAQRMQQQISLDETLPTRLTGLDGKAYNSPKTNQGGV